MTGYLIKLIKIKTKNVKIEIFLTMNIFYIPY